MRRKIIVIILIIIMCLANVILYNNDEYIAAESGGEENYNGSIAIENDFVWDRVQDFCNVVYNASWIDENNIPKGRAWGTAGENYTIDKILRPYMKGDHRDDWCNLTGVTELPIGYVDAYPSINYSSKMVTNDFQLTIYNNTDEPYIYSQQIPKTEVYPLPMAWKHYKGYGLNHNLSFENASIVNLTKYCEDKGFPYPFAGTFTGYSLNITYDALNFQNQITVGIPIYVESNDNITEEQDGMLFIIDEEEGCEEKINNITNVTGCVLIHDNSKGYTFQNATNYSFPIIKTNYSDNYENVTNLIEMLENGTFMIADNYLQNGYMTFTYNFSENNCDISDNDWFFIKYNRAPSVSGNAYNDIGDLRSWRGAVWYLYDFITYYLAGPLGSYCLGFILYDYTNTHFMTYAVRDWSWFGEGFINQWSNNPPLPIYSINNSVGEWLNDHADNTTISGYMDQEYKQQTPDTPGVESYNVVGYRNTTISPDDKITILSNRMDGFWGQTPGDSGVGGAIVLGIAKYMNDYNITPKYNLTFLFTTGEEYGMRGAQHYYDTHPINEYNFNRWIGTDQLGFKQNNTKLNICYTDETSYDILYAIANQTDYYNRTGYEFNVSGEGGNGTEKYVWKQREGCDAISFDKGGNWDMYHRAGENYTAGDVLTNIDREDVNITFELVWNITKYFTVDPDCWFTNVTFEAFDSPNDGDALNDSIRANFSISTIMPYDKIMIKTLYSVYDGENLTSWMEGDSFNYTITKNGLNDSIVFSIPDSAIHANYSIKLQLYNSTGCINKIVGIGTNNYNETSNSSNFYHLYHPFGYTKVGSSYKSVADNISGSTFTINENGYADNITAYINQVYMSPGPYKCMLYRLNDSKLIATTTENWTFRDYENPVSSSGWAVFNFSEPKPELTKNTEYVITCWGENSYSRLYYDDFSYNRGCYDNETFGDPPVYANFSNENRLYSIYCSYTPDNKGPKITAITSDPGVVGFGMNTTISVNVTDLSGVYIVKVHIIPPEIEGEKPNCTMVNTGGSVYEYVFNNTWVVGEYNYTIWALDNQGNSNTSEIHCFNVSAQANISVCTVKDEYGEKEFVNVTDPESNQCLIGYELLDDNRVLHVWNRFNSYYFNTSNGIQLTNHYNKYWSHNVLMLGYYNNDQWNLVYRVDNLSGFNKNIVSDNKTFVNVTLWKDLTYQGYNFRLAIRYCLGVDDIELTVIPYIKNLGISS